MRKIACTLLLLCAVPIVAAQTLHDPAPILGNAVTESARASAMNSAFSPRTGSVRTPEQSAARLRDLDWVKSCRAQARVNPSGPKRSALVKQCKTEFDRRREYWK
jgi:invasion protein IalB